MKGMGGIIFRKRAVNVHVLMTTKSQKNARSANLAIILHSISRRSVGAMTGPPSPDPRTLQPCLHELLHASVSSSPSEMDSTSL